MEDSDDLVDIEKSLYVEPGILGDYRQAVEDLSKRIRGMDGLAKRFFMSYWDSGLYAALGYVFRDKPVYALGVLGGFAALDRLYSKRMIASIPQLNKDELDYRKDKATSFDRSLRNSAAFSAGLFLNEAITASNAIDFLKYGFADASSVALAYLFDKSYLRSRDRVSKRRKDSRKRESGQVNKNYNANPYSKEKAEKEL